MDAGYRRSQLRLDEERRRSDDRREAIRTQLAAERMAQWQPHVMAEEQKKRS